MERIIRKDTCIRNANKKKIFFKREPGKERIDEIICIKTQIPCAVNTISQTIKTKAVTVIAGNRNFHSR